MANLLEHSTEMFKSFVAMDLRPGDVVFLCVDKDSYYATCQEVAQDIEAVLPDGVRAIVIPGEAYIPAILGEHKDEGER